MSDQSTKLCAGVSGQDDVLTDQQRQEAEAAAVAAQRQQETLEHAQKRAQLEEATLPLMLDAMWAANVLDIETTLRHVCKKVWVSAVFWKYLCLAARIYATPEQLC